MTLCWAVPLGTVRPVLVPSWLSAEPRITPQIRSPSASASLSLFSTTIPQPSPRTKPLAEASKALHRPSGDNIRALARSSVSRPERIACTPPVKIISASPCCRAETAWCSATSEEEQAVSTAMAGPSRPRAKATRPAGRVQGSAANGVETGGRFGSLAGVQIDETVIHVADADVDPGAAALQPFRDYARILESLPARFQHQPLLRIQQLRFHRRNAKELRIK